MAAEILQAELPGVRICLSSDVCPEMREYERFSTTCANAYVQPLMAGYLDRLSNLLTHEGLHSPLYLMMSGGGLTTLDQAVRYPVRLIESGPAGGALMSARLASARKLDNVLSFDMGGTTAKISLIQNGRPDRSATFEVAREYRDMKGSGLPVRIPVIDMVEIGQRRVKSWTRGLRDGWRRTHGDGRRSGFGPTRQPSLCRWWAAA